jgi:tetratricopeptide (TPR) repeat protein
MKPSKTPSQARGSRPARLVAWLLVAVCALPTAPAAATEPRAAGAILAAALAGDEAEVLRQKHAFLAQPKPASGDREKARQLNAEGLRIQRLGNDLLAVQRLSEAARADPSDAEVHANLGAALLAARRPAEARRALENAVELSPGRAETWCALGEAHAALGDTRTAVAAFRLGHAFSPDEDGATPYLSRLVERGATGSPLVLAATIARDAPPLLTVGRAALVAHRRAEVAGVAEVPAVEALRARTGGTSVETLQSVDTTVLPAPSLPPSGTITVRQRDTTHAELILRWSDEAAADYCRREVPAASRQQCRGAMRWSASTVTVDCANRQLSWNGGRVGALPLDEPVAAETSGEAVRQAQQLFVIACPSHRFAQRHAARVLGSEAVARDFDVLAADSRLEQGEGRDPTDLKSSADRPLRLQTPDQRPHSG